MQSITETVLIIDGAREGKFLIQSVPHGGHYSKWEESFVCYQLTDNT